MSPWDREGEAISLEHGSDRALSLVAKRVVTAARSEEAADRRAAKARDEAARSACQVKNLDLLKAAEAKLVARRNSLVGVAAKVRVAAALSKLHERASERLSERSADGESSSAAKAAEVATAEVASSGPTALGASSTGGTRGRVVATRSGSA